MALHVYRPSPKRVLGVEFIGENGGGPGAASDPLRTAILPALGLGTAPVAARYRIGNFRALARASTGQSHHLALLSSAFSYLICRPRGDNRGQNVSAASDNSEGRGLCTSGRQLADSDEGGQLFRLKADSASDRLRTPFR
jgi:hypothetical protein